MGDYMAKRFKAKKQKKFKVLRLIFIVVSIYILYKLLCLLVINAKLSNSNEEFIVALLNDSNHHMLYEQQNNNIVKKFLYKITNADTKHPVTLLENVFGYELDTKAVASDVSEETEIPTNTEYISDPNPVIVDNPRVYIYNSHQLEDYNANNFEEYNITPNVLMASYLLKEKLNKQNIPTIVETSNITDFLNLNGWDYASSYKASRFYILDALNKYSDLDLMIDLHRDAIPASSSTVEIDGKKYAKVLFVVGIDHANYAPNLELATKLNDMIKEKYPTLTRGVITKGGKGVDGIYNQDLSSKIILIECGGNENSIDEVMNTIEILSEIIKEYLGD